MAFYRYASLEERMARQSKTKDCGYCTPCQLWKGRAKKDGYKVKRPGNGAYGYISLRYKHEAEDKSKPRKFPVHWIARVLHDVRHFVPGFNSRDPAHMEQFWDLLFAYRELDLSIDHLCVQSLCINPHHLEWVPLRDNIGRKRWMEHQRTKRLQTRVRGGDWHSRLLIRNSHSMEAFKLEIIRKIEVLVRRLAPQRELF